MDKIPAINKAITEYFAIYKSVDEVPAKNLMTWFIKKGVFDNDHQNGLPIRNILRKLDKKNELNRIPTLLADRKAKNTNWFFVRSGLVDSQNGCNTQKSVRLSASSTSPKSPTVESSRDEDYVIDLCDKALNRTGSRQHKFAFLVGDPDANGTCRQLPVDSYYEPLSLVIEYRERQHTEQVKHFDKPDVMTVSGVHRGEQRRIYDQRRRDILPCHGITLIELSFSDFEFDNQKRLVRNYRSDFEVVKNTLKEVLER